MSFQKGQPRPAGAGRKKGMPNYSTKLRIEEARETMAKKNFNPVVEMIRLYRSRKPVSELRIKMLAELLKYWGSRLTTQRIDAKISGDLHLEAALHRIMLTADEETIRALEKLSLTYSETIRDGEIIDAEPIALLEPSNPVIPDSPEAA